MSEQETNETITKEVSTEEKLAATYKRILITVIFCCIGWPIFLYAFNYSMNPLVMLLGGAVVSAPILWIMARGGGLKDVFKTDEYEVVTTYSDGSKKSDGGTESFIMGLITKIIGLVLVILIGCLITIGLLVYMTISYVKLYLQASNKPAFVKSAFPILLAGLIVFIGSGIVVGNIARASAAKARKEAKEINMIIEAPQQRLACYNDWNFPEV
ncbi:MAG: hypothetical protein FWG29_03525 [Treponema sp.]|nr:hypothetical protein [Treponema sp.]